MKNQDDGAFLVQHLVDPNDWVADRDRKICHVCTRTFGTFRRKHHCRMCGEVMCGGCTLYKNAIIETIGSTKVRVCITCVFNHSQVMKLNSGPFFARQPVKSSSTSAPNSEIFSPTTDEKSCRTHTTDFTCSEEGDESIYNSPIHERRCAHPNHIKKSYDSQQMGTISQPPVLTRCRSKSDHLLTSNAIYKGSDNYENNIASTGQVPAGKPEGRFSEGLPSENSDVASNWSYSWPKPPVPVNEFDRLTALLSLNILNSRPEKPFDMICDLAKERLSCPIAAVGFMDNNSLWFKASSGLAHTHIPREIAFCSYTIMGKEPIVVLDTHADPRFQRNPLVTGNVGVRFYAAAPILDPSSDQIVGTVFVLDTQPHKSCDTTVLERLAFAAGTNLELRTKETRRYLERQRALAAYPHCHLSPIAGGVSASNNPVQRSNFLQDTRTSDHKEIKKQFEIPNSQSSSCVIGALDQVDNAEAQLAQLLSRNQQTQEQLAGRQQVMANKIGFHSSQIQKLILDMNRIEAKIEAKLRIT